MKSVNKKAIACLLAVVMVFESISGMTVMAQTNGTVEAVGAAGDSYDTATAMQLGKEYHVTVGAEGNVYYKFTPQESGSYFFSVTGDWVSLYLHDEDYEYLDDNWGDDFELSYDLVGGKTYYLNISEEDGEDAACTICVNRKMLSISYSSWYEVTYGEKQILQVSAQSERGQVSYQWYKRVEDEFGDYEYEIISGATQSSYTVTADETASEEYRCIVTDGTERETAEIWFEVLMIDVSTSYPSSVEKGEQVTMSVQAESLLGKQLTYQWYHEEMVEDEDGEEYEDYVFIPGAIDNIYQVIANKDYDYYKCVISDGTTTVSKYFTLHVATHIKVTGQTKHYVKLGNPVTFQVKASSSSDNALTYEWRKMNLGEYSYTTIPGANSANYTVRAAEGAAPYYQCAIQDGYQTVYMQFEFQIIPPTEKEIDRIVPGEGWPTEFVYEEVKTNDTYTNFTYNKPLTVKYKDGTERTVNYGYCCWLDPDFSSSNSKAYISYMGKTVSYDVSIVKMSETGTELPLGEKISDQAGMGAAGRKYYSVSIPANGNYIIQISDFSGEGKEILYSGLGETEFTNDCYEPYNNGISKQIYFSVEAAGTQPISYSIEVDTVQNNSQSLADQETMQQFGYYRVFAETSGLYEVMHMGYEKDKQIAVLYNEELEEVCNFYNQSTKYYLQSGEVYYIKNEYCGSKIQLAEEKNLPTGTKAGVEDKMIWTLTDNGILTIEGKGDMPEAGYKTRTPWVRTSWNYKESDSQKIQQIKIGDGITAISRNAFSHCGIEEIQIPDSVQKINWGAFYRCKNLKSVSFSSNLKQISDHAFYGCESLRAIALPPSLTEIGSNAFWECTSLSSVRFSEENNLEYIAQRAFEDTAWAESQGDFVTLDGILLDYKGNAKEVVIPDSVHQIAPKGLENIDAEKIVFPKQLDKIWECGVSGCKKLKEINIPGSVSDIAYQAFAECTALENAVINEGTEKIEHHAFAGCSALKNLTIKEGVKIIGDNAFINDRSLTNVTIPKSVLSIGDKAFGYYSSFYTGNALVKNNPPLSIYCYPNSIAYRYAAENALPIGLLDGSGNLIEDPPKETESDSSSLNTGETYTVKDYDYEIIGKETVAFAGLKNKNSKKVSIPTGVTIAGKSFTVTGVADGAFQSTNIKTVTMPVTVQSIGAKAFYNCKQLFKITIPSSIGKIGSQAFGNCKKLKNITVKTTKLTKKNIGKNAFKNISAKATIKVPKQKLKTYKKLFKLKGVGAKVKYKK